MDSFHLKPVLLSATLLLTCGELFAETNKTNLGSFHLQNDVIFTSYDKHAEAKAWAKCVVTYRFFSEVFSESKPAVSKQYSNMANGANLAIVMSVVSRSMQENQDNFNFPSVWNTAKTTAESEVELQTNALQVIFETDTREDSMLKLGVELGETNLETCSANATLQQMYVDLWRDLSASGLLSQPD